MTQMLQDLAKGASQTETTQSDVYSKSAHDNKRSRDAHLPDQMVQSNNSKPPTEIIQLDGVEHIGWHGQHIATVIRSDFLPDKTTFVTPESYYQQAGYVVYPQGGEVKRHIHLPLQRHLVGTPETLIIRKGCAEVALYSMEKQYLHTVTLREGDIILLVSGGHGIKFMEDTVICEIKQGPFTGLKEKEIF
jgi:hypothetical protein